MTIDHKDADLSDMADFPSGGTDLRDVPPEARVISPDLAAAAGVARARLEAMKRAKEWLIMRFEKQRTQLREMLNSSSKEDEVKARICLYDQIPSEELQLRNKSYGNGGYVLLEFDCSATGERYLYYTRGAKKLTCIKENPQLQGLLAETPDTTILYKVGDESVLTEIHRWDDQE
ncbi:hypothetical protein JXD20_00245 [Candidatus Peregrinibacteria bacterium]|nr:hypothetical protein [Candidatus Peregrinibacteria bacterium]